MHASAPRICQQLAVTIYAVISNLHLLLKNSFLLPILFIFIYDVLKNYTL